MQNFCSFAASRSSPKSYRGLFALGAGYMKLVVGSPRPAVCFDTIEFLSNIAV
jgi:hypothetical protein